MRTEERASADELNEEKGALHDGTEDRGNASDAYADDGEDWWALARWAAVVDTADDDDGSRGDCKDCVQHNRDDRDGEEEAKVHVDLALRCAILVLHHEFCVVVLYRWCT